MTFTNSTFTVAKTSITTSGLTLSGYDVASSISAMPTNGDSLNAAIQKLAYVLSNSTTPVDTRITNTISTLSATLSQTASDDGLALSLTQSNGIITALSGSIGAITYTPRV